MAKYKTREQWLMAGLKELVPFFTNIGRKVPQRIRVSCGFPSKNALGARQRRIGECWSDNASHGKYFEIFISPVLSKPLSVLDTLIHEVVHAVVGLECGHGGDFKKVALAVGLVGKMTSTKAGPYLAEKLRAIGDKLGAYPHDELSKMTTMHKPRVNGAIKATCPGCGYKMVTSRKWFEEAGLPTCPCGEEFETT